MAASKSVTVRLDWALNDELKRLIDSGELPYSSPSEAIQELITYALLSPKRHAFGEGYARAGAETRHRIHDFAAEVSRRGLAAKGQLLEAVIANGTKRDPSVFFDQIREWADSWARGENNVFDEITL